MASRLIINADDFGLTRGINRAIGELHDAGVLTSTTLMAAGAAFAHAVEIARKRPGLGVGCHIVLTDGTPVAPPRSIPSLLARDGRSLRPRLSHFLAALLTGQIDTEEVEREAVAQITRIQQAGLTVTHLDAHKHTHIAPPILSALLRAARRTGVRAIRNPFEQPWAFPLSNGTMARTSQIRLLRSLQRGFHKRPEIQSGEIQTTDGTIGVSATGHLDEPTLRSLLGALPNGTWELVCHPGYSDADLDALPTRLRQTRDTERQALLAVLGQPAASPLRESVLQRNNQAAEQSPGTQDSLSSQPRQHLPTPELIHYGDLASASR